MENILLDATKLNGKEDNISKEQLTKPPYFVEIQKSVNVKIKIPCSNETIAKKLLAAYSNYNSKSKAPLMGDGNFKVS